MINVYAQTGAPGGKTVFTTYRIVRWPLWRVETTALGYGRNLGRTDNEDEVRVTRRSLSLRVYIDLTRRVDDGTGYGGTVVARAKREWSSAAGCGGRHLRIHDDGSTTVTTIIADRVPEHTSSTADEHPLTFGRRQ